MRDTKPFASLSSGLLARKGAAKPAMRPQSFSSFGSSLEDLGWNDMGHHQPAPHQAEVAPLSGAAGLTPAPARALEEPPVVAHQRALEQQYAPEPVPVPVEAPAAPAALALPRRRGEPSKAKAAFTLRLDTDRHLKLRLACALTRASAQQLVTGALDEFLKSLPEVDRLAERVPAEASGR
jgi:hypothetical protein